MNLSVSPDVITVQDVKDGSDETVNENDEVEEVEPELSEVEKNIIETVMSFNVSIEEASER